MRELAKAGVMVGFCGGGGTLLFAGTEATLDVAWFAPQSEYRPTEYLQHWVRFWFDDGLRLVAAKAVQQARLGRLVEHWQASASLKDQGFSPDIDALRSATAASSLAQLAAIDVMALLAEEARLSKTLYRLAASATRYGEFTRARRGESVDAANRFLDHGNYLAYGLAASACWVLGLPHGLAVLHGKTRRGGLVFDAADLVKDAVILPQAFCSAMQGHDEQRFRQACIEALARTEALDFMIDTLKGIALRVGGLARAGAVEGGAG